MSISVVDEKDVSMTGKRAGRTVVATTVTLFADRATRTERQSITGIMPATVEMTRHLTRVAAGSSGAHLISGSWQGVLTVLDQT